jgi:tRNA threonylcarbamoyladenosine biosynthesis protein TsaE
VLATLTLRNPSESPDIARLLLQGYPEHRVFALHGDLGAGQDHPHQRPSAKRTGREATGTSSPSFSMVNEYWSAARRDPVYHLDLYRMRDARELEDIGLD